MNQRTKVCMSYFSRNYQYLVQNFIVFAISIYQRYLSPKKGFSCAYRLHHHSESCSNYVKQLFVEQDLKTAIFLSEQRFQECSQIAKTSAAQQQVSQATSRSSLIGRRGALRFFSLFTLGIFPSQLRSGCPGVQACCSAIIEDKNDNED